MNNFTRREFLYLLGGGVVSLLLLDEAAADLLHPPTPLASAGGLLFSLRTRNGADLLFYGQNLVCERGVLRPAEEYDHRRQRLPAYLIVQVPAQSRHEAAVYAAGPLRAPTYQVSARLAGPSFLVFELWPELRAPRPWYRPARRPRLRCTLADVLAWHDMTRFRLVAANEEALARLWPAYSLADAGARPSAPTLGGRPYYDFGYYRELLRHCFGPNFPADPRHLPVLSLLEAPAGLLLSVLLRRLPPGPGGKVYQAYFATNGNEALGSRARRQYWLTGRKQGWSRTVQEGWQAELRYGVASTPWVVQPPLAYNPRPALPHDPKPAPLAAPAAQPVADPAAAVPTPQDFQLGLRVLGFLADADAATDPANGQRAASEPCAPVADGTEYFLPSTRDKATLRVLNQLAQPPGVVARPGEPPLNLLAESYDLRVTSAFVLGGRGASFKFAYKNHRPPLGIDLVEYEHHLQDGCDNFIRVAYIGVLAPVCLRALYVKQVRRRVHRGKVYLDYKERIELLETSKTFPRLTAAEFAADEKSGKGVAYECFALADGTATELQPAQLFFTRVEADFTQMEDMQPVSCDEKDCFWPKREGATSDSLSDLLTPPFRYYDANGDLLPKLSQHPVLFLSRSLIDNSPQAAPNNQPSVRNLLQNSESKFYLGHEKIDDGRLRIPLHGQVVALTEDAPPDPDQANFTEAALRNRPNHVATNWAEYYFQVAKPAANPVGSLFDRVEYLIITQVRLLHGCLDHVQGVAGAAAPKLVSLLCYDENYLRQKYTGANSKLRLMLRHTQEFRHGQPLRDLAGRKLSTERQRLYADLDGGMQRIRAAFAQAGEKLGGLVNPDPVLEYVAGIKENIALPARQAGENLAVLLERLRRPLEILNGDAAELLGGIKLVRILRAVLGDESTPSFVQNRFNADLASLADTLNEFKNPVLRRALATVDQAQQVVRQLREEIEVLQRFELPTKRQLAATAWNTLLTQLPDLAKVKKLLLVRIEQARLQLLLVAEQLPQQLPLPQLQALKLEVARALQPYLQAYRSAQAQVDQAAATIHRLPDEWKDSVTLRAALALVVDWVETQTRPLVLAGTQAAEALAEFSRCKAALLDYAAAKGAVLCDLLQTAKTGDLNAALAALLAAPALEPLLPAPPLPGCRQGVGYLLGQYELLRQQHPAKAAIASGEWDRVVELIRLVASFDYQTYVRRAADLARQADDLVNSSELLHRHAQKAVADAVTSLTARYQAALANPLTPVLLAALLGGDAPYSYEASYEALRQALLIQLQSEPAYQSVINEYQAQRVRLEGEIAAPQRALDAKLQDIKNSAQDYLTQLGRAFEAELRRAQLVGEALAQALEAYDQARRFLTTPVRREVRYDWQTTEFVDIDLGVVRFIPQSSPATALRLHSSTSLVLDPRQLAGAPLKVSTALDTVVSDFALEFLGVLNVGFAHLSVRGGTGRSPAFDVQLRGVRFVGALTFFQGLQDLLAGLIDAFLPIIQEKRITISYQSPVFGVSLPGFIFSNLSFGVSVDLYLDRQPLVVQLRLARPESKATVAVGILGGGFYFAIAVSPSRGVVGVEMALEIGAILGLSLGPIRGEVRFMAGLYYRKYGDQVILEGYFIAEGTLKVWIISVSARLYMAIRSYGSYVQGICEVSYKVKVGFLSRSFSARFEKTIAGTPTRQGTPTLRTAAQLTAAKQKLAATNKNHQAWEDHFEVLSKAQYQAFCQQYY